MNLKGVDGMDFNQDAYTQEEVKDYLAKNGLEYTSIVHAEDFGKKWWRVIFKKKEEK